MATKQCKSCKRELPIARFDRVRNAIRCTCKDCRNAATRKGRANGTYKPNPEKLRAARKRSTAKRKVAKCWLEPSEREKRIAYKRRYRAERGAKPKAPSVGHDLWERNARQAWRHWFSVRASDEWISAYYAATPWRDHRLSKAQKFKLQYELDSEFNAKQRDKAQRINPERKAKVERLSDGTITPTFLRTLFAAAVSCPYCLVRMGSYDKSLDHIEPLDPGMHTASNVCVCCKRCNVRKRRMSVAQFMSRCESRREAA